MVSMPNKTRTAVTIGAVLVVAIVGAFWLWAGTRGTHAAPPDSVDTALSDPQTEESAPVTTPSAPVGTDVTAPPQEALTEHSVPATYTVKPSDTLENISLEYYGDKKYWGLIERLNQEVLQGKPDLLVAGMTLKMPKWLDVHPAGSAATDSTTSGAAATTPTGAPTPTQSGSSLPLDTLSPSDR